VPSIIISILCCVPAGAAAIILSIQASTQAAEGKIEEALAKAKLARILLIVSVILGLLVYSIYLTPTIIQIIRPKPQPSPSPITIRFPTPDLTGIIKTPTPTPTPAVSPAPFPFTTLSGLSVEVFYLPPSKGKAERIGERLMLRGARVRLTEYNGSAVFSTLSWIYFYGDRKVEAQRISAVLMSVETVYVSDSSTGPTRTLDEYQFFIWVGKDSR
jgi:hypothetical protein